MDSVCWREHTSFSSCIDMFVQRGKSLASYVNTRDNKPYVIADLVSDSLPESLEADVCVVGSGPVGITLALALSRRNARVILLESGGRKTEPALQDLYRSKNIGHNHNGINIGRYRVFGG